jgi:hypothetical protein
LEHDWIAAIELVANSDDGVGKPLIVAAVHVMPSVVKNSSPELVPTTPSLPGKAQSAKSSDVSIAPGAGFVVQIPSLQL